MSCTACDVVGPLLVRSTRTWACECGARWCSGEEIEPCTDCGTEPGDATYCGCGWLCEPCHRAACTDRDCWYSGPDTWDEYYGLK